MTCADEGVAVELLNGGITLVSEADHQRVIDAGRWFWIPKDYGRYVCRNFGESNKVYLHRFVTNAPKGLVVDHLSGDTLDNRQANLRVVTQGENVRNRGGAQRNSKSRIRGVYWHAQRNKWAAAIKHKGKNISLGLYEAIEDATAARIEAEKTLWSPGDRYRAMISASPSIDEV